MNDCYYNSKSRKYKPHMKKFSKIEANLRKRNLIDVSNNDKFEFEFKTVSSNYIGRRWFLDSCASRHLTNQKDCLVNYRVLSDIESVNAASEGRFVQVIRIGNLRVRKKIDGIEKVMVLRDAGYAPKCRTNLVPLAKAQM